MKFTTFAALCLGAAQAQAAQYTDYFFRYAGGNDIINGQRLRSNNSIDFFSPGVTQPPYNPEDRKPIKQNPNLLSPHTTPHPQQY